MLKVIYEPEPPLAPLEDKVFGCCHRCGGEIYSDDYVYNGEVLCGRCYEEAYAIETVIEFIKSYPDEFTSYLRDMVTDEDERTIGMLEDYRDFAQSNFDEWVVN